MTKDKDPDETVRTVPRGYFEEGANEDWPEPTPDPDTGEMTGHGEIETPLPDTAQETNAPE